MQLQLIRLQFKLFLVGYGFIMLMDSLMFVFGDEYGKLSLSSLLIGNIFLCWIINQIPTNRHYITTVLIVFLIYF